MSEFPDGIDRAALLDPPICTAHLPGVGGRLRARLEDFQVEEIPAYPPDGRTGGHLLLLLRKRGLGTDDALQLLAAHLRVDRSELGAAGRKDAEAVTEQWISVPASAGPLLPLFEHPAISLGPPHPHGHKLKTGHLRGNRFVIVIRDLAVEPGEAIDRARAKLDAITREGGIDNVFGPQRFGRDGITLDRGLEAMRGGRGGRRGNMIVAAGQAALFNMYTLMRRRRGLANTVLLGDVLKKADTGGLFTSSDPATDQARLDRGELGITGPIFGSRMRAPPIDTPAAALEADVLAAAGVTPAALRALGRKALGTRRPCKVGLGRGELAVEVELAPEDGPPDGDFGPGLLLRFVLPAGSYATRLCAELQTGGSEDHIGPVADGVTPTH